MLISFVFGMDPYLGLGFLLSLHAVVHSAGSTPRWGSYFCHPANRPDGGYHCRKHDMKSYGRSWCQLSIGRIGWTVDDAFFGAPTESGKRGHGTEQTPVLVGVSLETLKTLLDFSQR